MTLSGPHLKTVKQLIAKGMSLDDIMATIEVMGYEITRSEVESLSGAPTHNQSTPDKKTLSDTLSENKVILKETDENFNKRNLIQKFIDSGLDYEQILLTCKNLRIKLTESELAGIPGAPKKEPKVVKEKKKKLPKPDKPTYLASDIKDPFGDNEKNAIERQKSIASFNESMQVVSQSEIEKNTQAKEESTQKTEASQQEVAQVERHTGTNISEALKSVSDQFSAGTSNLSQTIRINSDEVAEALDNIYENLKKPKQRSLETTSMTPIGMKEEEEKEPEKKSSIINWIKWGLDKLKYFIPLLKPLGKFGKAFGGLLTFILTWVETGDWKNALFTAGGSVLAAKLAQQLGASLLLLLVPGPGWLAFTIRVLTIALQLAAFTYGADELEKFYEKNLKGEGLLGILKGAITGAATALNSLIDSAESGLGNLGGYLASLLGFGDDTNLSPNDDILSVNELIYEVEDTIKFKAKELEFKKRDSNESPDIEERTSSEKGTSVLSKIGSVAKGIGGGLIRTHPNVLPNIKPAGATEGTNEPAASTPPSTGSPSSTTPGSASIPASPVSPTAPISSIPRKADKDLDKASGKFPGIKPSNEPNRVPYELGPNIKLDDAAGKFPKNRGITPPPAASAPPPAPSENKEGSGLNWKGLFGTNPNVIPKIKPSSSLDGVKVASLDTTSLYGAKINDTNEMKFPRPLLGMIPSNEMKFPRSSAQSKLKAEAFFKKPPVPRRRHKQQIHHHNRRHAENELNSSPPSFAQDLIGDSKIARNQAPSRSRGGGKIIDFSGYLT